MRTLLLIALFLVPTASFASSFSDVPDTHPNADAIAYVKAKGIVEGYVDGTFKADSQINRAEFIKILTETYGQMLQEKLDPNGEQVEWLWDDGGCRADVPSGPITPFSDTKNGEWYTYRVCLGLLWELVDGYPDNTFRPGSPINFAEAAKILANAYGLLASTTIPACDGDCPWYRDYVIALETRGAIPTSITSFDQKITRGEMAEMIYRLKSGDHYKPSGTYEGLKGGNSTVGFFDSNFPVRFDYPMAWKDMIDTDNSAPWFIGLGPACDGQTCARILGNHRLGIVSMLEDDPLLRSGFSGWESYVNTKGHVVYAKATVGVCAEYEAVIVSDIASARVFGDCLNDDPLYAEAAKGIVDSMDFYKNW